MVIDSGTPKVNIKDVKVVTNTWGGGGGLGAMKLVL